MYLYHGSPNKFDKFSFNFIGENGTAEGYGFYFSNKVEIASRYAEHTEDSTGYIYKINAKLSKSINGETKQLSIEDYKHLIRNLGEAGETYLSCWGEVAFEGYESVLHQAITCDYEACESDVAMICSIANACGDIEAVNRAVFKTFGITHIHVASEHVTWGENHDIYVVLVPEIIKIEGIVQYNEEDMVLLANVS